MLRLGDQLVVRLPRIASAVPSLAKESQYSPLLGAAHLPAPIPVPLAQGTPGRGYPWPWTVYGWLEGENPSPGHSTGRGLATDLATFIRTLHAADLGNKAPLGPLWSCRGGPLAARDAPTWSAIDRCQGLLDTSVLTAAWDTVRRVSEGNGTQVWIHTDLHPGKILARRWPARRCPRLGRCCHR